MKKKFTNEQEQYIKDNYLNYTYDEIASHLGNFTGKQVRTWASHNGLRKNRKINDDYFDEINTPLKAYFLGFIYADGWVTYGSTCELGMELQSRDKYILDKLNNELGNKNIIYHHEPYEHYINNILTKTNHMDCLRVYSKSLVNGLIKNGVVPNKTKNETHPIVSNDLFFDWLRGYIDGDGCFYNDENNNTIMNITCSSLKPLEYVQKELSNYNISSNLYTENERKHRLMCFNNDSIKLLINHLYYKDDLFYLKRKYEKIKHLIGFAA